MQSFNRIRACAVLTMIGVATPALFAENVVGLTASQQLVSFDSATPGTITNTSAVISGLAAGDRIVDIDFYPVNNILHGMGSATGNLYRINALTGVATLDAAPQASMGSPLDVDFNPAADRLRVFSANDQNFRITPSVGTAGPNGAATGTVSVDGTLMYAGGTPNPNLVANAYNNNFDGTAATTLYSLDTDTNSLVIHSGTPQFSMLAAVGPLGVDIGSNVGFDISPSGATYVSDGNNLYNINLGSGALTLAGAIGGPLDVVTIAVVTPEPSSALLLALAGLALRRRN